MAASFRNTSEILELAGSDLLTISPALLDQLTQETTPVTAKLQYAAGATTPTSSNLSESQRQAAVSYTHLTLPTILLV